MVLLIYFIKAISDSNTSNVTFRGPVASLVAAHEELEKKKLN